MPIQQRRLGAFINAGGDAVVLERIVGADNQPVTQASVTSITFTVIDRARGQTLLSGSLSPSAVVYDSVQDDNGWDQDSPQQPSPKDGRYGWNFRWVVPAVCFSQRGRLIEAQAVFKMMDGSTVVIPCDFTVT